MFQQPGPERDNFTGPIITSYGIICVILKHKVRVDVSLDRSLRLINCFGNSIAAMNSAGTRTCLIHPTGRVYQNNSKVDIQTFDGKFARMSFKGVAFTSRKCPLVYLVDDAGTRTTTETFYDIKDDCALDLFYTGSRHGPDTVVECFTVMQDVKRFTNERGDDIWIINGVKIVQNEAGDVTVSREQGRRVIKASPTRGTMSVNSPLVYASASSGANAHTFARRGERRLHADSRAFVVRNGSHSAGFNEFGRFTVY